jgi:hypothetical protein
VEAKDLLTNNPEAHVKNIEGMLEQLITDLRESISKVDDPKAEALFETSAEVLQGLQRAYQHFNQHGEEAWR